MALHDLYAAIWDRSSGPAWQARHRMSAAEYQQTFDQMLAQGYRLRMVSGYAPEGHDLYAAVWEHAGGPAWQARHRMSAADYQHTFDQRVPGSSPGMIINHINELSAVPSDARVGYRFCGPAADPPAHDRAYRRGDLFEKRATLMADWAAYLSRPSADVVALRVG